MNVKILTLLIGGVALAAMIARDTGADLPATGRYQITGTQSRVWRVDTITGALTTCFQVKQNGERGYRCIALE